MNLKPPITRTGRSGWLRHGSIRLKSLMVVGALALGFAGAAIVAAGPASADPSVDFVAVGSDTTENLMDFFAAETGGGVLASYDAVNPVTQTPGEIITPAIAGSGGEQLNCSFTRPNGSGQGFKTLDHVDGGPLNDGLVGASTSLEGGQDAGPGCITLSRSSGAPGSVAASGAGSSDLGSSSQVAGNYVYIPFAVDAVTWATGPLAATVAPFTFTSTAASPAVFTASGNNFTTGEEVTLTTSIAGSSGNAFTAGTGYFVVGLATAGAGTFELAATQGGTPIAATATGSGSVQFAVTSPCNATINSSCPTTGSSAGQITFNPSSTQIPQNLDLTQTNLKTLYGTCGSVSVGGVTYSPDNASFTFTVTSGSAVLAYTGATFNANQPVTVGVSAGGTLPAPLSAGVTYYVVNPGTDVFSLATTPGGTAITITSAGSGTFTVDTPGTIDLYAPQNGSGTLSFWETSMGVSAVQPCWHQTIIAGQDIGQQVEEHDGTAIASDPIGIAPISIAKWIGMNSQLVTPDVRHGDVLQPIAVVNGTTTTVVPPIVGGDMNITGCSGTFNQAECFPINREVYNVMDYYEVEDQAIPAGTVGNTGFNPILAGLFAGSSSALCTDGFTITGLGFGQLPSSGTSTFADTCGSVVNRVQMNSLATQG